MPDLSPNLTGAKVLILATDGFEESELFDPRQSLLDAGVDGDPRLAQDRSDHRRDGAAKKAGRSRPTSPSMTSTPTITTRCCCPAASATPTNCG